MTAQDNRFSKTPRQRTIRRGPAPILLLALWPLLATNATANQLGGTANWTHSATGGPETDTRQSFRQTYRANFNTTLTSAMALHGGYNYDNNWNQGGGSSESYNPNLALQVSNDIFSASLSGTSTTDRPESRASTTTQSWQTNWSSAWHHEFWPTVDINYGQSTSTDDASPRTSDTDTNRFGFSSSCNVRVAKLFYSYTSNTSTNNINTSESQNTGHLARLETGRSFLDNRLSVRFSHQYTRNTSEFTSISTPGGTVELPSVQTLSANIIPPIAVPVVLTPQFNPSRQVDRLTFTFAADTNLDGIVEDNIQLSPVPTVTVTNTLTAAAVATNQTLTWDSTNERYVLDLALPVLPAGSYEVTLESSNYLASFPVATTVAMQAIPLATASGTSVTDTSQTTNNRTNIGFGFRIRPDMPLAYNLSLETITSTPGAKSERRTQSAGLTWNLHQYFKPSVNVSETRSQSDNAQSSASRSFSLSATSSPLPTLDLHASATRSENFIDSVKITTSNTFGFGANATLYPDLTGSLAVSHAISDNELQNSSASSWASKLALTARLSSKLTADWNYQYATATTKNSDGTSTDSDSSSTQINLTARPSDLLSIRANANKNWSNGEPSPLTYGASTSVTLLRTRKTHVTATYNYAKSQQSKSEDCSATWSWAISRYLTMQTNGSYQITGSQRWSINSRLSSNF